MFVDFWTDVVCTYYMNPRTFYAADEEEEEEEEEAEETGYTSMFTPQTFALAFIVLTIILQVFVSSYVLGERFFVTFPWSVLGLKPVRHDQGSLECCLVISGVVSHIEA